MREVVYSPVEQKKLDSSSEQHASKAYSISNPEGGCCRTCHGKGDGGSTCVH